jgi:hypothetical protein
MSASELMANVTEQANAKRKALHAALAKAQEELEGAKKQSANPHFRSKYANLAGVFEAWQEVGPKNGLGVLQLVEEAPGQQGIYLRTILTHSDGGSIEARSFWPAVKNDPQAYGSALTYARRYTLMALTGICPVEDDDGNAATKAVNRDQDRERFLAGLEKNWSDKAKLGIIATEALKAGLSDIADKANKRAGEL